MQDLNKLIGKDVNLYRIEKREHLGDTEFIMAKNVKIIKVNKDTVTFRLNRNQAIITTKKNEIYRVTDKNVGTFDDYHTLYLNKEEVLKKRKSFTNFAKHYNIASWIYLGFFLFCMGAVVVSPPMIANEFIDAPLLQVSVICLVILIPYLGCWFIKIPYESVRYEFEADYITLLELENPEIENEYKKITGGD